MSRDNSPQVITEKKGSDVTLYGAVSKSSSHPLSRVLREISLKVAELGAVQVLNGNLDPPLASEDMRTQVTLGLSTLSKDDITTKERMRESINGSRKEEKPTLMASQLSVEQVTFKLPQGNRQDDIALLLEQVADVLDKKSIEQVCDLRISNFVDDSGIDRPSVIVYFSTAV